MIYVIPKNAASYLKFITNHNCFLQSWLFKIIL